MSATVLCFGPAATPCAAQAKPNIVFVLTDDLDLNLVQFMPHVLAMERNGVSFANYFVTDSGGPSRSSIFTGEFPITAACSATSSARRRLRRFKPARQRTPHLRGCYSARRLPDCDARQILERLRSRPEPSRARVERRDVAGNGYCSATAASPRIT